MDNDTPETPAEPLPLVDKSEEPIAGGVQIRESTDTDMVFIVASELMAPDDDIPQFQQEPRFGPASDPIHQYIQRCASHAGLEVEFPAGLTCLRNAQSGLLPAYLVFEGIDEHTDIDAVVAEMPGLTYSQVTSMMDFIRELLQYNHRGIDFDELEDTFLLESGLDDELRRALQAEREEQ